MADDTSDPPVPALRGRGFSAYVLPALAWLLLIFVGGGADVSEPPIDVGLPIDKLQHVVAFAVMQLLFFRALRHVLPGRARRRKIALAAFLSVGVGVALELYQLGLPHRSAEFADVVADALGAGAGALFLAFRRSKREDTESRGWERAHAGVAARPQPGTEPPEDSHGSA